MTAPSLLPPTGGVQLVKSWQLLPAIDELIEPATANYVRIVQATARKMRADITRTLGHTPHTRLTPALYGAGYLDDGARLCIVYTTTYRRPA